MDSLVSLILKYSSVDFRSLHFFNSCSGYYPVLRSSVGIAIFLSYLSLLHPRSTNATLYLSWRHPPFVLTLRSAHYEEHFYLYQPGNHAINYYRRTGYRRNVLRIP